MKIKIEINGDNKAFYDSIGKFMNSELDEILEQVAYVLHQMEVGERKVIRDSRDVHCGFVEIED